MKLFKTHQRDVPFISRLLYRRLPGEAQEGLLTHFTGNLVELMLVKGKRFKI